METEHSSGNVIGNTPVSRSTNRVCTFFFKDFFGLSAFLSQSQESPVLSSILPSIPCTEHAVCLLSWPAVQSADILPCVSYAQMHFCDELLIYGLQDGAAQVLRTLFVRKREWKRSSWVSQMFIGNPLFVVWIQYMYTFGDRLSSREKSPLLRRRWWLQSLCIRQSFIAYFLFSVDRMRKSKNKLLFVFFFRTSFPAMTACFIRPLFIIGVVVMEGKLLKFGYHRD